MAIQSSCRCRRIRQRLWGVYAVGVLLAGVGFSCANAASLVLYSTMDNSDISGSTVHDLATPAQDGALSAAATSGAAGIIGEAIVSSTTTGAGAVDYGDVLNTGTGIQTISVWFNADTIVPLSLIANKGNTGSTGIGWSIFTDDRPPGGNDYYRIQVRATATGVGDDANRAIAWADLATDGSDSTNTWHHVAFVLDATGGTVTGYLDGLLMTGTNSWGMTFTTDGDGIVNTDPLRVGAGVDGRIDDFAIFSGALSEQEIISIYQNGLQGTGIPEPASVGLLGLSLLMMGLRRHRDG